MPDDRSPKSFVLDPPAAPPADAGRWFREKLSMECDAWDVHEDRKRGVEGVVVADARDPVAFADLHVPGALNLQSRRIDGETAAALRGKVVVVYAWGTGCNAATKTAARLAELGIAVKEMLGGLESWCRNGYPVEGRLQRGVPFEAYLAWHHSARGGEPYGSP